jgi:hypothetical protein
VHGVQSLVAVTGGYTGGVFFPNPLVSAIDLLQDSSSLVGFASGGMTALKGGAPMYGATTAPVLSSSLTSYRVSSWGLRLHNLQAVLSAQGRVYIAMFPSLSRVPSYADVSAMTATNGNSYCCNAFTGSANLNSSTILELPNSTQMSISELIPGMVTLNPLPNNTAFYSFKPTINNSQLANNTFWADGGLSATANGTITNSGGSLINDMTGGTSVVIFVEGLPTASIGSNVLEVEYIYHLEGTPIIGSSANQLITTSHQALIGSTETVERAIIANPPTQSISFVTELEAIGNTLGKGVKAVSDFSRTPVGNVVTSALLSLF